MKAEDMASASARRELAEWSQPVVVDFLRDLYGRRVGHDHPNLRALCVSHGRAWRYMLQGDVERLAAARRDTTGVARLAGLKTADIVEIDAAMLDELMDVIVSRFQRAPAQAAVYGRILLGIAGRLSALAATAA